MQNYSNNLSQEYSQTTAGDQLDIFCVELRPYLNDNCMKTGTKQGNIAIF